MTTHITARVAWHDDGWNGRICKKPECNAYCIGKDSYPSDTISRERNLTREMEIAHADISTLSSNDLPPCTYSVNAFGDKKITGYSKPPDFIKADRTEWTTPAATISIWPYDNIFTDEVKKTDGTWDNDKRVAKVDEFFNKIETNKSLIFYYANYANPLSTEEDSRYLLVGASKIKAIGESKYYENADEHALERYANARIWARNITSHFPEEGFRIPYHRYLESREMLKRIAVVPENPILCKYVSRPITDDDAIGLLEQLLNCVIQLQEIEGGKENWKEREEWLNRQISQLWKTRGLYPGLLNIMDKLEARKAIVPAKELMEKGDSKEVHAKFFKALKENKECAELGLEGNELQKANRQWILLDATEREFIENIASRLAVDKDIMNNILSNDKRNTHGLETDLSELLDNPYIICEKYVGKDTRDFIPWSIIDRGVFPSLELGGDIINGIEKDHPYRLRALCIEQLKKEPTHAFQKATEIQTEVNERLQSINEWKQTELKDAHFEVDRECFEKGMVLENRDGELLLYLKDVYEDERYVEENITSMSNRPDLPMTRPFELPKWENELRVMTQSSKLKNYPEYSQVISEQARACEQIFNKPISIITGAAGTGKTSVLCGIMKVIKKVEGEGTSISVLAPTGKAADRVRANVTAFNIKGITKPETIHAFLRRNNWLNDDNYTLKRTGGNKGGLGTIIIDEASMLDLSIVACLVRAIDWDSIKRLILVGDPNQLPPIGRGRFFYDAINWFEDKNNEAIVKLKTNVRQLENKIEKRGTSIIALAELFKNPHLQDATTDSPTSIEAEELIAMMHKGGTVGRDLRIEYWNMGEDDNDNPSEALIKIIEEEMEANTQSKLNEEKPFELWRRSFTSEDASGKSKWLPEKYQILTPNRYKVYGVEELNKSIQKRISSTLLRRPGDIDGITLYDKVMQYKNRSRSNPIAAFNRHTGDSEDIEIFNGEIGFVSQHNVDKKYNHKGYLHKFQVNFQRKEEYDVGYGNKLPSKNKFESVSDNLELAYAISIHKAQGSEFDNTYIIIPKESINIMSTELIYTAITRASKHCTLLIERDISSLLNHRRLDQSQTEKINSTLFEGIRVSNKDYTKGKSHLTVNNYRVRSKSEETISNLLNANNITKHQYEELLRAQDGSICLPNFTIQWRGQTFYWEHWGEEVNKDKYKEYYKNKIVWYSKHFPNMLIETFERDDLSEQIENIIQAKFAG